MKQDALLEKAMQIVDAELETIRDNAEMRISAALEQMFACEYEDSINEQNE